MREGPFVEGLRCRECARSYPAEALHVCEWCFGPLEVVYDYEAIAASTSRERIAAGPKTIWRYADLLPASAEGAVDLGAGLTPLLRADRLGAELGLSDLWLKNDTVNPTGSFKDRVVSVALTRARELGFKVAACASTGNLANSVAAHAARAGMRSVVCIPADLEIPKVVTTAVFGGTLVALTGNYDEVNRLCAELASEYPTLGFRQRQRPQLLRRGLEDPCVRGRRTARVEGPRPCGGAGRFGKPARQGGEGFQGAVQGRACWTRNLTCAYRVRSPPAAPQ